MAIDMFMVRKPQKGRNRAFWGFLTINCSEKEPHMAGIIAL